MSNNGYHMHSCDRLTAAGSSEFFSQFKHDQSFIEMERNVKLLKYPTTPVKSVQTIDKWMVHLKQPGLERNLKKTLKTEHGLKFIRKIRGDGNCFIRAVAFQFLTQVNSTKLEKCFPYLRTVSLTVSDESYIPKNFLPFYDNEFLSYCLKQNWELQYEMSLRQHKYNNKLALASMLAQNAYFDFIIVLYIRAVSVLALKKFSNDPEIREFLQDHDEDKLRNYGNFSDGLTQFLLHKLLSIQLNIFQVRNQSVINYNYPCNREKSMTANLLFHGNHYDLLQKQADIDTESTSPSLHRKESFYMKKNNELVEGQCINCQQLKLISVQNCLCQACFMKYESALNYYSKNKVKNEELDLTSYCPDSPRLLAKPTKKLKTQMGQDKKKGKTTTRRFFGCFG